jgi:hypothetical protein
MVHMLGGMAPDATRKAGRRSIMLLRMSSDCTHEFIWIISKYGACKWADIGGF